MAYINDLFKVLVNRNLKKWPGSWAKEYEDFTSDVSKLKERLTDDRALSDQELYKNLKTVDDYPSFLRKLLYDKANGISSRGQSTLAETKLKELQVDKKFEDIIKELVIDPSSEKYTQFRSIWKSKVEKDNKVLINRAFAASFPERLNSTVDEPKFFKVLAFLKSQCAYGYEETGNWYEANVQVTTWLDDQLKEELYDESFRSDRERHIWRNIFYWLLHEFDPGQFDLKKQLVKYGAPGTGKTYGSKRQVGNHFNLWKARYYTDYEKEWADQVETVQFHPSYTYEDFLEGIRPVLKAGKTELKLTNGIFKRLCEKAAKWEIDLYRKIPELKLPNELEGAISFTDLTVAQAADRLNGELWSFLKDVKDAEKTKLHKIIPPFYLIIDEINRAELSRVLGELMYCLEYRGIEGKIKTQYSSLVENENSETAYWYENGENYFFIPHNLYIIGTMNNIDRSVESFDFALRRRFQWQKVLTDYNCMMYDLPDGLVSLADALEKLNDKIAHHPLLGEDYQVGHSYFMERPDFIDKMKLKEVKYHFWNQNIRPLLEEYLRGADEDNNELKRFEEAFLNG